MGIFPLQEVFLHLEDLIFVNTNDYLLSLHYHLDLLPLHQCILECHHFQEILAMLQISLAVNLQVFLGKLYGGQNYGKFKVKHLVRWENGNLEFRLC